MQWFIVGLEGFPFETVLDSNSLVMNPDLTSDGLNGAMFTCKVTMATGNIYQRNFTLRVKGKL